MCDQQMNCAAGICCCEANCHDKRRKALREMMDDSIGAVPHTNAEIADYILNTYDISGLGTLEPIFIKMKAAVDAGHHHCDLDKGDLALLFAFVQKVVDAGPYAG